MDNTESTYHLKWIQWEEGKIPIVMQSINGPCPLIATMNVLLLRKMVKLPRMLEQITATQLLTYLGECITDSVVTDDETVYDNDTIVNLERNIDDAIKIMPKLKTGLDVNIKFNDITHFEYTPECIIFDLLRIPLYHGWLSDPCLTELHSAIGDQSYNQLVDNIITYRNSQDPEQSTKALLFEEFLEKTASQLTLHGLNELKRKIKENEIGILFRNNHFLTIFKREEELYTLVTDHGYLTEDNVIWEILDNIEGAGRFFDSNFQLSSIVADRTELSTSAKSQVMLDYLMALKLNDEEAKSRADQKENVGSKPDQSIDFQLAKMLQAEEDARGVYEMSLYQATSEQDPKLAGRRHSDLSSGARDTQVYDKLRTSDREIRLINTINRVSSSEVRFGGNVANQIEDFPPLSNSAMSTQPAPETTPLSEPSPATTECPSDRASTTDHQPTGGQDQGHFPSSQSTSSNRIVSSTTTSRRVKSEKSSKESNCSVI